MRAKRKKQTPWTKAARGQPCQFRIAGVCLDPYGYGHETVVACHISPRDGSKGTGMKVDDVYALDGCIACHDVMDGVNRVGLKLDAFQIKLRDGTIGEFTGEDRLYYAFRAFGRTLLNREQQGVATIKR